MPIVSTILASRLSTRTPGEKTPKKHSGEKTNSKQLANIKVLNKY